MRVVGLIPCRYSSTRFLGKPLAIINYKPMMWHVYQRCMESSLLNQVFIVTDNTAIFGAAKRLGLNVLMTRGNHETGTDRIAEAAETLDADYYVNIQGDEPMMDPNVIDLVAMEIIDCLDETVVASNAFLEIKNKAEINDPNVVKVIFSKNKLALAFSRSAIPYSKENHCKYYKQLGIYAFKKEGLLLFKNTKPLEIEKIEGVEMYRLIENNYNIKMIEAHEESISVDTHEDLNRVIKAMEKNK